MDNKPSFKAMMFCVLLVFSFAVVCVIGGIWERGIYNDYKENCTKKVLGVVTGEAKGTRERGEDIDASGFTGNKRSGWWVRIDIKPGENSSFRFKTIYDDVGDENVGDTVVIHYSPDDPYKYYIEKREEHYKDASTFAYVVGALCFIASLLLLGYTLKVEKSRKKRR